jgi:hypothetical protein
VLDLDYGQYRLNGDLVCPWPSGPAGNAAVAITGEGVHFNLKGYTITRDDGFGRWLRWGIEVTGAKAHINGGSIVDINCPLRRSDPDCSAIYMHQDAHGAKINGMSLHNNTTGIYVVGHASGARIHGNDISPDGAVITGNDLSDTGGFTNPDGTEGGAWGYWGAADDVALIGNVANNCARRGILLAYDSVGDLQGFAERNTIRENETLDNGRGGIFLWAETDANRPRDNLIQSNTAFGNGSTDLAEGFRGSRVDCLNTWKHNEFDVAEPADCIE